MTTDSDSECSYVANLADFNVIRVIIIVIVIKIIVIKIIYNSKKSNNSNIYIYISLFVHVVNLLNGTFQKHKYTVIP